MAGGGCRAAPARGDFPLWALTHGHATPPLVHPSLSPCAAFCLCTWLPALPPHRPSPSGFAATRQSPQEASGAQLGAVQAHSPPIETCAHPPHAHTHAPPCTHPLDTCAYPHKCACTPSHVHTHNPHTSTPCVHTHTHTHAHTPLPIHHPMRMHTLMLTYTYIPPRMNTHTYPLTPYAHACTCTHTYLQASPSSCTSLGSEQGLSLPTLLRCRLGGGREGEQGHQ